VLPKSGNVISKVIIINFFVRTFPNNYVVQNYTVYFGLYPSSGIYDKKSQRFGDWICLRPQVDGARQTYSVGPVRKRQSQSLDVVIVVIEKQLMITARLIL
jgi:hypothetical protein